MTRRRYRYHSAVALAVSMAISMLVPHDPLAADPYQPPAPTPVSSSDTAPPPGGVEASIQYWLHHFNMCSLVCLDKIEPAREDPLDLVRFFNAVDEPWYISLNEICQSEIKQLAADTGLSAAWVLTKRVTPNCPGPVDDERFGNAVLYSPPATGPNPAVALWFQNQEEQTPACTPAPASDGSNECRGAVCVRTNTFFGDRAACSSHLESDDDIAYSQSDTPGSVGVKRRS